MTAAEKREAIRLVEESELPARRTLQELQIPRTTFYRWYRRYRADGVDGLTPRPAVARRHWNRIPPPIRQRVVDLAVDAIESAKFLTEEQKRDIFHNNVARFLRRQP